MRTWPRAMTVWEAPTDGYTALFPQPLNHTHGALLLERQSASFNTISFSAFPLTLQP